MKTRHILLPVILLVCSLICGCAVATLSEAEKHYQIQGWTDSVNGIKKEYHIVDKIEYKIPGVHVPNLYVYLSTGITLQEAEDIVSHMKDKLFTGETWKELNGYFETAGWSDGIHTLEVELICKDNLNYIFRWDLSKDSWEVGYYQRIWQSYTPTT